MPRFLCVFALILCVYTHSSAAIVIDFEELNAFNGTAMAGGFGEYYDGYGSSPDPVSPLPWTSQGAFFNTGQYGPGWSYSNVVDSRDHGGINHQNQWAAYPGGGVHGSENYALAYYSDWQFGNSGLTPNISLPNGYAPHSVYVTNSSYAYWVLKNGGDGATAMGGASGDEPDFFKAVFTGLSLTGDITGSVEFYLADFQSADNAQDYIVDDWQLVDLSGLGHASVIELNFVTSDMNGTFPNTPTYIAIDNLRLTAVPEPGSLAVLAGLGAAGWWQRRRRSQLAVAA